MAKNPLSLFGTGLAQYLTDIAAYLPPRTTYTSRVDNDLSLYVLRILCPVRLLSGRQGAGSHRSSTSSR